jgi:hypothetical protein
MSSIRDPQARESTVGNVTSRAGWCHPFHVAIIIAALTTGACSSDGKSDGTSKAMQALDKFASDLGEQLGFTTPIQPGSDEGKPGALPAAKPEATAAAPEKPAATRRTASRGPAMPVEKVPAEPEPVPIVAPVEPRVASARSPEPDAPAAPADETLVVNRPSSEDALLPIYSEDDDDVIPAQLLTTQTSGPLFTGIRPHMNTMELVISPAGRVETVKLMSQTKRMTDMLLLSGAKTWKFTPALREGQPVRYKTMFSWEITP